MKLPCAMLLTTPYMAQIKKFQIYVKFKTLNTRFLHNFILNFYDEGLLI
jgi:hypothetical protein